MGENIRSDEHAGCLPPQAFDDPAMNAIQRAVSGCDFWRPASPEAARL